MLFQARPVPHESTAFDSQITCYELLQLGHTLGYSIVHPEIAFIYKKITCEIAGQI